jgi:mRNA interferase MazF
LLVRQGDVWWAELPEPQGSEAGLRRPVLVVQGDSFNRSRIATVVCVPLTSQLRWADAPGNVLLRARSTGLPRDSVANVSLLLAVDRSQLDERAGAISEIELQQVFNGIDVVLGKA